MASEHERLRAKARTAGIDKGIADTSVGRFASLPTCSAAGLSAAHVLALRLWSSPLADMVSLPLQEGCTKGRPHPFPTLVVLLVDAYWRLRAAQADAKRAADSKAAQTAEAMRQAKEGDDDDLIEATTKAAAAAAEVSKQLSNDAVWVGTASVSAAEFKWRGVSEVGFLPLTKHRSTAVASALTMANLERRVHAGDGGGGGGGGGGAAGAAGGGEELDDAHAVDYLPLKVMPPGVASSAVLRAECSLAPPIQERKGSPTPRRPSVETTGGGGGGGQRDELPVRLIRIATPSDGVQLLPVDLREIAPIASDGDWFYPPGTYLEWKKEALDTIGTADDGEDLHCKMVEATAILVKPVGIKAAKDKEKGA